ncbi:copper homeostasis protein CutC [Niallia circulans]|jgi:copper homeostasis protein|uniref:PF03932 family protein CutC n=2 Tax=Bacillaceae TaxID=186817 RepID=A0A268FFU3_NIACI|nr:copper homeostasis protein CutC [Niallia circulans]AYV73023.1 copper homeostasis protein CutC [Niallia circulans]PAD84177.1 copper homeostasis protein CutC [Niallia circulans]QJX64491.1 copper homeostasis protein CutC [Niallia circulans]
MIMIKEVCVENFTLVPSAIQKGADRIELCDNLSVGGTTVSYGVAAKTISYCRNTDTKVMAIIRPRGGNFMYNEHEIDIMCQDIRLFKELGINGAVIGCLDKANWIDEEALEKCLDAAAGMEITFHMAFDEIAPQLKWQAIDWLASHGVHRILTHGGPLSTRIENNLPALKSYIEYASEKIIIIPGGGITSANLPLLSSELGMKEAHGTRILGDL